MTREESHSLMQQILSEDTPLDFIGDKLKELAEQIPTSSELLGYLDGMLEVAIPMKSLVALDLCGTGGDGKSTFNISTTTAFVLASMDVPVAKHGNSAASSKFGSSDVLRALGVKFPETPEEVEHQFRRANLVFLHAPFFHPALKRIAPVRKQLGIRTIFNMLGPLANPVQPGYQMVGVANPDLLDVYAGALSELKRDFALVHTIGGHDEISLTDEALLLTGSFRTTLKKEDFGLESYINEEDLACRDTAEENAALVREILGGKGTLSQNYVVAANAATAASLYFQNESYLNLFQKALEVLRKKSGIEHLELSCQQS